MIQTLPICRWRGPLNSNGRYQCNSEKIVAPGGVTANLCKGCILSDHEPIYIEPMPTQAIAPACGWLGTINVKPWQYRATVAVAHLNTIETLELMVESYRLQTVRPYILIIDTGSSEDVCKELEKFRAEDLEIHYIRAHAYFHSSAPVTVALDLIHALCRTNFLFHTHTDVFPKRRDLLEWYINNCNEEQPVIGYEMSERAGTDRWKGTVSHTATMLYMPTIRKIGATWSLERFYDLEGWPEVQTMGWPDTESMFDRCLRDNGIKPVLIAREPNYQRYVDSNIDHARSYTGLKLGQGKLWPKAQRYSQEAITEARERIYSWKYGKTCCK